MRFFQIAFLDLFFGVIDATGFLLADFHGLPDFVAPIVTFFFTSVSVVFVIMSEIYNKKFKQNKKQFLNYGYINEGWS